MMKKSMKKRVAVILIVALGMTICPGMREEMTVKAVGTGTVKAGSEGGSLNRWTPTSSWEEEEVVEHLDNDNTDENGYTYKLTVRGTVYTAQLTMLELARYRGAREDIVIRVPDKVEKDGVEYVVTQCSLESSESYRNIKRKVRLYIGKGIENVFCGNIHCAIVSYVHSENENYISRDGVLLSKDETTLVRFGSETYEPERVYTLPEQVEEIHPSAFIRADVKEVVLNEKITELPWRAFEDSCLQKIDLKNVNAIDRYVFMGCFLLKEVKINCPGIVINEMAFDNCGIENLYIPSGAVLEGMSILGSCLDLETVVMGEGSKILAESERVNGSSSADTFLEDIKLKTLILPEGTTEISKECLDRCCTLRKLYVPDSVEAIQTFNTTGKFTLYGRNEGVMETHEGNAAFVNISEHKHVMKEVTFFEYDSWGVKGKYCEECGYGCDTELVEYVQGNVKEEMPELLYIPEEGCPDKLELDKVNRDSQGVVYQLDDVNGTAKAVDLDDTFDCGFVAFPETVEKNGKTYVLETIGSWALSYPCSRILVSDSVKNIEDGALSYGRDITLGKNVSYIEEDAFCNFRGKIHLPEDNVNFKISEGALYTADGRQLIHYCSGMKRKELVISATVEKIWSRAFWTEDWLEMIYVYGKDGKFNDNVFPSDTEIIYIKPEEEDEGESPMVSPTPETEETMSSTPSPGVTVSPAPSPGVTASLPPESKETVSPTPESEETIVPVSTELPFETELPNVPDAVQTNASSVPNQDAELDDSAELEKESQNLSVMGLQVSTKDNYSVTLRWKANTAARNYRIYRAARKNGTYKVIRTVGNSQNSYVDKKVKPLKRYYYKVIALGYHEGKVIEGSSTAIRSICISGVRTPKIVVKKGQMESIRYVTVILKQHQGKYADIYIAFPGKKFKKLKLVSSKISKYKGKFKIRYVVKGSTIRFKVRTYKKQGKKKWYSNFSSVVKVKV